MAHRRRRARLSCLLRPPRIPDQRGVSPGSSEPVTMFGRPSPFWDPFTRYDSGWYYQIARYGYLFVAGGPSVGVGKAGKIAYFPLYPLLMRFAGRLFGRTGAAVYLG